VPPFLSVILGNKWNQPLDFNRRFWDGKPIFGTHKTIRGIVGSIIGATICAPAFGLSSMEGMMLASLGMLGDLITSFIKRRLDKPSGTIMPGLDQFLEGMLPLIVFERQHHIGLLAAIFVLTIFSIGAYWGSIFYKRILLATPVDNYPRILNPRLRFREWKACQIRRDPLRFFLNFEDAVYYHLCLKSILKILGYYQLGVQNALNIKVRSVTFSFANLPPAFHGYSILFLSDLHINGHEKLPERIKELLDGLPVFDICILGGDYRMEDVGSYHSPLEQLASVIPVLKEKSQDGVVAVLGNHDCIEMVTWFEQQGVTVLVNEHMAISRNGESIYLVGVDDPHYFRCHDVEAAFQEVPQGAFSIFIAHSPEVYREAARHGASLYLCGHTHAGQIQLPRLGAIFTHSRTGWRFVYGQWKYKSMWGYTSSGVGASGIFARFNTRGEIVQITLLREGGKNHDS